MNTEPPAPSLSAIGREKAAGILLHTSSLPGQATGEAGEEWLRWLRQAGQRVWQLLPIHPPGAFGSPYDARSVFALDPDLLAVSSLPQLGLRAPDDRSSPLAVAAALGTTGWPAELRSDWTAFRERHRAWLDDWCLFAALEGRYGSAWPRWPSSLVARETARLEQARIDLAETIAAHERLQFLLRRQWTDLRARANRRGVLLFGDLPIYPALHSADAWAHRELFSVDRMGRPTALAGVPPDAFSDSGQLWGNPVYRWDQVAANGYRWWIDRVAAEAELFDLVRLDHFRGFVNYWEVPAGADSAVTGSWMPGPGSALFDTLSIAVPSLLLVAEDLGEVTDEVASLRDELGMPGMIVLQFGFDGNDDNPHAPGCHRANSVVYTGTHDNPPSRAWYRTLSRRDRARVRQALGASGRAVHRDMIQAAYASPARLAIVPAQDVLGLGEHGQMNAPGVAGGNWAWRLRMGQMSERHATWVRDLTISSNRRAADRGRQSKP